MNQAERLEIGYESEWIVAIGRTPNSAAKPGVNPWIIAVVVAMAAFMEVLDTSIANVALSHIVGSLGAGQSESTWVLTTYLVANAIVIPISGWLSSVLGRKLYFLICLALFTFSSFLCGIAPSLPLLLLFRVMQGAGGGGLQPVSQAMLADTFEGPSFGMAFAVYGVAVVVAPALGPAFGGWITDNFSWRWIFFINVPVGLLALILAERLTQDAPSLVEVTRRERSRGIRVDYMGFAFSALAFGALQIVLDKGQEDDWFGSRFICVLAVMATIGFVGLVVWEIMVVKEPIVDLPLMSNANLATSMGLMFAVGFVLNATTVVIPQFAQQLMGYDATKAGLLLMPGGAVMVLLLPLAGKLVRQVQPKYLLASGFLIIAGAFYYASGFNVEVSFGNLATARFIQCIGLPLCFVPMNTIAYSNLPPGKSNNASSLMNLMRNLGGSVGISVASTMLDRRSQVHHAYLAGHVSHFYPPFVQHMAVTGGFTQTNILAFFNTVHAQALMLSYLDVFHLLLILCLSATGVVLLLRKVQGTIQPSMAH